MQSITDGDSEISYTYNGDGLRTSKTVNGETTNYYYNGSILAGQKSGDDTLVFMYDNNSDIFGFIYNDTEYYYIKNAQNDVIAIADTNGNILVKYAYDAWGKVISITDKNGNDVNNLKLQKFDPVTGETITEYDENGNVIEHIHPSTRLANINPILYRSYYYDKETKWYYLNTRYYSPDMCRFVSSDGIIQTGQGMLDKNMFAYCLNDPVNKIDPNGTFTLTSTIIAALFSAIRALLIEIIKIATIFIITVAVIVTVKWAAEKIKNKTNSKSSSKKSTNRYSKNNTEHTVYKLVDPTTNEIKYVGRTVNPTARKQAHGRDPSKQGLVFVTIKGGLNYYEARGLEQIAMLTYSTHNALNRINGISPNNPKLEDYMAAGRDVANYVDNQISNEILYWTGE